MHQQDSEVKSVTAGHKPGGGVARSLHFPTLVGLSQQTSTSTWAERFKVLNSEGPTWVRRLKWKYCFSPASMTPSLVLFGKDSILTSKPAQKWRKVLVGTVQVSTRLGPYTTPPMVVPRGVQDIILSFVIHKH